MKFHGRKRELKILHGIYNEICTGGKNSSSNSKSFERGEVQQETSPALNSGTSVFAAHGDDTVVTPVAIGSDANGRHQQSLKIQLGRQQPSVAFVSGCSGSGKSSLVMHFIDNLMESTAKMKGKTTTPTSIGLDGNGGDDRTVEPFFLVGKFDELSGADPFSAIVEAFTGFASKLLDGKNSYHAEGLRRIRRDVRESLRPEDVSVLTAVVPALDKIIATADLSRLSANTTKETKQQEEVQKEAENEGEDNDGSTNNAWNRLKYVLQLFVRTVATRHRPIVMFLDDLQWADNGSLDIVQALVTDKTIQNFMFIGTYRSEEVGNGHPLNARLARIEKVQPIEAINMKNLSIEEMIVFLNDHIKIHPNDCTTLATKVHAKTDGNIYFTVQVLAELNQNGALIFSHITKIWEWDDLQGMLVVDTALSDNVLEAVETKIRRAPRRIQRALVVMAYARSTMDIGNLHRLMEMDSGCAMEIDLLVNVLDRAVLEGFFSNNVGSDCYSFSHDKVQQASYSLVSEGKAREEFRLSMGRRLYEIGSSDDGEPWMLFAAAEHLNASPNFVEKNPLFLAQLNLNVGERASKISAYDQASTRLRAGLDALLRISNPWKGGHYDLTLKLHRAVADIELSRGNFQIGIDIGRYLLNNARNLMDKLPTYMSLATALGREELHAEALEMNRDALLQLGDYPKRNYIARVAKDLIAVRRFLKDTPESEIMKLPIMKDRCKESALVFLRGLAIQAFYCDNQVEFILGTLRALRITFKYGLSGYSAMAIIAYGMVQSELNDHEGSLRATRLARRVLEVCDAESQESIGLFCISHFIEGWSAPHEKTLEAYRIGHKSGMEAGDVESAYLNSWAAVHHARTSGSPLGPIEGMTGELLEQMELHNVKSIHVLMEQTNLPVQYLTGNEMKDGEPDWGKLSLLPTNNRHTSSENLRLLFWYIGRVELGVYFGKFDFADKMANRLAQILPRHNAYAPLSFRIFYSGLAASGMAKRMRGAGKHLQAQRYRIKAKRCANRLGQLSRSKGMNSYHRQMLLLADLHASGGKETSCSYDHAIAASLKCGHIHDAALGSELAGEYHLTGYFSSNPIVANASDALARQHFTRARDLYLQWGAYNKVDHLQKKRGDYIEGNRTPRRTKDEDVLIDNGDFFISSDEDTTRSAQTPTVLDLLTGVNPRATTSSHRSIQQKLSRKDDNSRECSSLPNEKTENDEVSVLTDISYPISTIATEQNQKIVFKSKLELQNELKS